MNKRVEKTIDALSRAVAPDMKAITAEFLRGDRKWPYITHLCVKEGAPLGGDGRCGVMLASECRHGDYTVRNHPGVGATMYGGPFVEKFDTIDALLAAGWVVD